MPCPSYLRRAFGAPEEDALVISPVTSVAARCKRALLGTVLWLACLFTRWPLGWYTDSPTSTLVSGQAASSTTGE
eukprot:5561165-Amphidinium_carterae.1